VIMQHIRAFSARCGNLMQRQSGAALRERCHPFRLFRSGLDRTALASRLAGVLTLALWAALLALVLQSVVAQSHVHGAQLRVTSTQSKSIPLALEPIHQAPDDSTSECPLCREAGASGSLLLPTSFTLVGRLAHPIAIDESPRPQLTFASQPSAWQSRAPPPHLQA
jgi:hypothetical protein